MSPAEIDQLVMQVAARTPRRVPISSETVARAEDILGFPLPPLLRALYLACGNGEFWPGVLPLMLEDDLARGPSFEEQVREPQSVVLRALGDAQARKHEDIRWPEKLLTIFDWGCTLLSCVDAGDPDERVVRFDGNNGRGEDVTDLTTHPNGSPLVYVPPQVGSAFVYCFELEASSLASWLRLWLAGHSVRAMQAMAHQKLRVAETGGARERD